MKPTYFDAVHPLVGGGIFGPRNGTLQDYDFKDGQTPPTDWWDKGSDKVQRTIKRIPADVLSYLGFGLVDDQLRIKYTVDTSTWSATLEKISVI